MVLTNGAAKHVAILGVVNRLFSEPFGITNTLGSDQNTLSIHTREDVAKTLALLTNQIFDGYTQVIEKHLRRCVIHHGANGADRQAVTNRLTHIN